MKTQRVLAGSEIEVSEGYEIQSALTGKEIAVKPGDRGYVDLKGWVHYTTGEARGKMHKVYEKDEVVGCDTYAIASMIESRLNMEIQLRDMLDDFGVPEEDFIDMVDSILMDVL